MYIWLGICRGVLQILLEIEIEIGTEIVVVVVMGQTTNRSRLKQCSWVPQYDEPYNEKDNVFVPSSIKECSGVPVYHHAPAEQHDSNLGPHWLAPPATLRHFIIT